MNPGSWSLIMTAILIAVACIVLWRRITLDSTIRRAMQAIMYKEGVRPGKLAILYFTMPDCAPCENVQRPAIQRLQQALGDNLQVVEIDASQKPRLASSFGVMTVPTTYVLDAQGRPRHVNHGVAPLEKLLEQLVEGNNQ